MLLNCGGAFSDAVASFAAYEILPPSLPFTGEDDPHHFFLNQGASSSLEKEDVAKGFLHLLYLLHNPRRNELYNPGSALLRYIDQLVELHPGLVECDYYKSLVEA